MDHHFPDDKSQHRGALNISTSIFYYPILVQDDPRFAGTVRAFEEDAFRVAVSPNTFTSVTLLWYAEALRAVGKTVQARNLVNALATAYTGTGSLSETIDLKESRLWGNFPSMPSIMAFMRVACRISKSWRDV